MSHIPSGEPKPIADTANTGPPFRLGHRPCLDGVRGVAILAVVAAHTERFRSMAAFVAVDLFFVLSGFLITCLLLEEWELRGTISLRRFYLRRVLRLLPALAVMLVVFVIYYWWSSPRPTAIAVSIDALVAFFYSSNWALAYGFHQPNLFGHAWSLSIEEQFYVAWPLLLVLLLRFTRFPRSTFNWLLLGVFLVTVERVLLLAIGSNFHRFFYGTDTRADRLLLGCAGGLAFNSGMSAAALKPGSPGRRLFKLSAYGSVLGLIFLSAYSPFSWEFDVGVVYFLIPIFGTLLILELVLESRGFLARLFETRWLTYIGKVSYGLYLWHYPIFSTVQARHWVPGKELAVECALTTIAVLASYYLLERPLLRMKKRFQGESSSQRIIEKGSAASE
ncbi:MAG TPA: acyltransferase [Candidatus Acidoferrum sp.]|jgi:peptidoglycan/LPS O-acetylase OafA/YrhL|nr:acyltransferase [Candidatus Acidoferrum sp.]